MCSLVVVTVLTEGEGYQKTELQATILCLLILLICHFTKASDSQATFREYILSNEISLSKSGLQRALCC
jgi:hypothetical protein